MAGAKVWRVRFDDLGLRRRPSGYATVLLANGVVKALRLRDERGVRTDEDGRFILDDLVVGRWDLHVEHDQFLDHTAEGVRVQRGKRCNVGEVTILRGAGIEGVVYTPDGERAVGGLVSIRSAGEKLSRMPATIGPDGTLLIGGLLPGTYELEFDFLFAADARGDRASYQFFKVRSYSVSLGLEERKVENIRTELRATEPQKLMPQQLKRQ